MRTYSAYLVLVLAIVLAVPGAASQAQNYAITGSSHVITHNEVLAGSSGGIELHSDGGKVFASSSYTGAGSTYADQGETVTLTITHIGGPMGQPGYSQFALVASGSLYSNGLDHAMASDYVTWDYASLTSGARYSGYTLNATYPSSTGWYQNFSAATTLTVDLRAYSNAVGGDGEDGSASANASETGTVKVK